MLFRSYSPRKPPQMTKSTCSDNVAIFVYRGSRAVEIAPGAKNVCCNPRKRPEMTKSTCFDDGPIFVYGGHEPPSATKRPPGLVIRAPEFSLEHSCSSNVADENIVSNLHGSNVVPRLLVKAPDFMYEPELTFEKLHDGPSPSEKEHKTSPGLIISVPEFASDEDDEVEEDKEAEAGDLEIGRAHV